MTITPGQPSVDETPLMNTTRAQDLLAQEGFDGVVTATLENTFYLSGVWNFGQELFPYVAESYVVAPAADVAAGTIIISVGEADMSLSANATMKGALAYGSFVRVAPADASLTADEQKLKELTLDRAPAATAVDAVVATLQDHDLVGGTIGIDERGPNRSLIAALESRLPETTFRPAADVLRRVRMVKTPAEQDRLVHTLRITEAAFEASTAAIYEGVTERELKRVFETAVVAAGARPAFALIRFGRGMALGQVEPGDTKLEPGDYVWYDIGCTYRGYRSDIGRIVSLGAPNAKLQQLYAASKQGQERAFEVMRPGVRASAVFAAAVDGVRQARMPGYDRHHVGHGIGVEFYDAPVLAPAVDTELEAGMVFEVETPYYELGFGGTFIEDTVIVRDDHAELVTRLNRELRVIDA